MVHAPGPAAFRKWRPPGPAPRSASSWNRPTGSPRAGNFGAIDSIVVIDANTVQFKLKTPQADLMAAMSDQYNFIIPKEISSRGKDAISTAADAIGSGPYELTEFKAAQSFSMKRRADGYWRPNTAWLDGFEYLHQTDSQQALNALRANRAAIEAVAREIAAGQGDGRTQHAAVQRRGFGRRAVQDLGGQFTQHLARLLQAGPEGGRVERVHQAAVEFHKPRQAGLVEHHGVVALAAVR